MLAAACCACYTPAATDLEVVVCTASPHCQPTRRVALIQLEIQVNMQLLFRSAHEGCVLVREVYRNRDLKDMLSTGASSLCTLLAPWQTEYQQLLRHLGCTRHAYR